MSLTFNFEKLQYDTTNPLNIGSKHRALITLDTCKHSGTDE